MSFSLLNEQELIIFIARLEIQENNHALQSQFECFTVKSNIRTA